MKDLSAVAVASSLLLAASLAWTVHAAVADAPLHPGNLVLVTVALWTATVASVAGMLVARSRWARRLGVLVGVAQAVVAVVSDAGPVWWVAVSLSALAALAIAGPWLNGIVRSLPAASGPPARAVALPLVLVAVPFAVGVTDPSPLPGSIVGYGALASAFWYIRALPGAVVTVRIGWPLLALATAWPLGWLGGTVTVLAAVGVAMLAWDRSVARAVRPLIGKGTLVPIPPELAPREILDAAGLDDRGRAR